MSDHLPEVRLLLVPEMLWKLSIAASAACAPRSFVLELLHFTRRSIAPAPAALSKSRVLQCAANRACIAARLRARTTAGGEGRDDVVARAETPPCCFPLRQTQERSDLVGRAGEQGEKTGGILVRKEGQEREEE